MAKDQSDIEHIGVVTMVTDTLVRVRIVQNSACSACHAKGSCSAADSAEKDIDVLPGNLHLQVGQQVILAGRSILGLQAASIAYLLPVIILFATLFIVFNYTHSEGIAAIASLGSMVPFYVVLSLFKNRLAKKFTFFIKQIIS